MRSTVVLVTVALAGYFTGALVHDTLPTVNPPAAFAFPVSAAELNSGPSLPAAVILPAEPGAGDSYWVVADRTENPRECDLPKGILTACIFMD